MNPTIIDTTRRLLTCLTVYLSVSVVIGQPIALFDSCHADDNVVATDTDEEFIESESADIQNANDEEFAEEELAEDELTEEEALAAEVAENIAKKVKRAQVEYVTTDYVQRQPESSNNSNGTDDETTAKKTSNKPRSTSSSSSSREKSGINGQFGHIGFKTFGRHESITHVELLPYVTNETHMWFSDLRLFMSNTAELGGNAGVGYRYYSKPLDQVFGVSFWYDADKSTQELFNQVGLSLESYGDDCEIRANFYMPIGDDEQNVQSTVLDPRFVSNNLQYDIQRDYLESLRGVDAEIGLLLPSDFSEEHNLKIFGGIYHFLADDAKDITGYKVRLQGRVNNSITTQVEYTDDDTFGSNVTIGAAILLPDGSNKRSKRTSKSGKLRNFVRRNYNVIVADYRETTYNHIATNPATGMAYTFQHVDTTVGAGGTGTATDPHDTVANAQAAGGDIIYVHSGSTIGTAITLQANQSLLGEGVDHFITIPEFGQLLLPSPTGGMTLPSITGVTGDAVTLASGSELSGFTINGSTGAAITGAGIAGSTVQNVSILGAGGAGIFLDTVTGTFNFNNVSVQNTTGNAFHVDGGSADVNFSGTINNTSGHSVLVENTTGGTVDLSGATISDTGGDGLLVSAADGNVVVGNYTSTNSTGNGVDIENSGGNVTFGGTTTVSGSTAAGIDILNTTGTVTFANVDVTTTGQTALLVNNASNLVVSGGTLNASGGGAAADIDGSAVNIMLTSVFADGGPFGVNLANSSGSFAVFGNSAVSSGGTIQNTTSGVILDTFAGSFGMQFVDFDTNNNAILANDSSYVELASVQVLNSVANGLDLTNIRTLSVTNSVFTGNGGNDIAAAFDAANTYSYIINNNTFNNANASSVVLSNSGAAVGSTLAMTFNQNNVTNSAASTNGFDLTWDGALFADFILNEFNGTGGTNTGIDINTTSTTLAAQIGIWQNEFNMSGGTDTGLQITTAGSSNLSIGQNEITFNAASGTGMNFNLAQPSTVNIYSNVITDNVSSGTGILFDSITGPANVAINDNTILLLSGDANVDRGIIFNAIPSGTVTLFGTLNNTITGATTPFSSPGGATTAGQIFVNGVGVN